MLASDHPIWAEAKKHEEFHPRVVWGPAKLRGVGCLANGDLPNNQKLPI